MGSTSPRVETLDKHDATFLRENQNSTLLNTGMNSSQRALRAGHDAIDVTLKSPLKVQSRHSRRSNYPDCSTCWDKGQGRYRNVATSVCHVCNIYLCGTCTKKHTSVTNEKHFISPFTASMTVSKQVVAGKNGYHSLVCNEEGHKDIPKYFCETCEDIVCLECIENYHKKHFFLYAKDAYTKHRTVLEQHIDQARAETFRISKQLEHEDSILKDLKAEKDDVTKKIKNQTAMMMEAIRNQEEQLLKDLDKMFFQKEEIVSRSKERCQNRLELINRTCRFTETAINDANELQVLVFTKYARKRLEEVCRPEVLTTDTEDANLKYFVSKGSPDQAKVLLGHLVDTAADPHHCVANGDGLTRAVVGQEACFIVTAKDKNNVPLTTGGDDVHVRVSSTQEDFILACVIDQSNGKYVVTYTPRLSGMVTISVRIYDQPIKDSVFKVDAICQRDYTTITKPFLTINGPGHYLDKDASFKLPCGVAVDEKGRIFIADCHNHCIKIISREGKFLKSFGSYGSKNGQLNNPTDVAISREKIYVCDKDNSRVQCFTLDGVFLNKFCFGCCKLKRPWGLCIDIKGNIIVADTKNNRIQVFSDDGSFVTSFGVEGSRDGEFLQPYFAAVHENGNIYITDNGNHRVQVFDDSYSFLFKFGSEDDALALKNPTGVTTDHQDHVIVADQCNSRLQVFTKDGCRKAVISAPLNSPQCQSYPKGLAVTQDGYIVVADSDNDRVVLL